MEASHKQVAWVGLQLRDGGGGWQQQQQQRRRTERMMWKNSLDRYTDETGKFLILRDKKKEWEKKEMTWASGPVHGLARFSIGSYFLYVLVMLATKKIILTTMATISYGKSQRIVTVKAAEKDKHA